uniref:F-box domain-containing protein n=1 Tax=Moniliophthora roreri TaxID=221103 RepID=A0A0W0G8S9_MONRR
MICRRWRELALQTSRLWAALHVSLPSVYRRPDSVAERFKRRADGVEMWFRRFRDLPIIPSLVVAEYKESHEDHCKPIVTALSLFAHRWQDVTLQVSASILKLFEGAVSLDNFPDSRK